MRFRKRVEFEAAHPVELVPVPIASDGAIATVGVGNGRLVPLVILDTTERPDLVDLVRAHRLIGGGDVKSTWAEGAGSDTFRLVLQFLAPSRCMAIIEFEMPRRGGLVDQVVTSQALYLQCGAPGDRLGSTLESPRILIEVPSADFRRTFEKTLEKSLIRDLRKSGHSRSEAREGAKSFMVEWRKFTSLRIHGPVAPS